LLKLHGQAFTQRAVKDRVAGGIREIRDDDGILAGQQRRAMKVEIRAKSEAKHDECGSRYEPFAKWGHPRSDRLGRA
jgi:hypothetical protein